MKEKIMNFFSQRKETLQKGIDVLTCLILVAALLGALFLIARLICWEWLKVGYSVAAGWILGKALFLPIGSLINRWMDSGREELRDRYYWWREKQR